jgi:hypothetical protein
MNDARAQGGVFQRSNGAIDTGASGAAFAAWSDTDGRARVPAK